MRRFSGIIRLTILCGILFNATSRICGQAYQGYTLFGPSNSKYSYLIDMNNQIKKTWTHSKNGGYSQYLLPDGSVIRTANSGSPSLNGGGAQGVVQKYNWAGSLTWEYTYSTSVVRAHHDICPMPNGNVLIIAWEAKTAAQAVQAGLNHSATIWPDHIIEVQPVGSNGGNIVWKWHAWDHLIQDYDPTKSNYGVVANHPELLDINVGSSGSGDWMHVNGITYNPELDQIAFSSHNLNEVYVIDHSTTIEQAAGHTGGNSGKGGDFLYRWGCPSNYRAPGPRIFDVVHCAIWIPQGLPGAGNLMAFNNRQSMGTSMVVELQLPLDSSGHYQHTPGTAYLPAAPVWSYTAAGFYTNHLGSCQRLPNGNTLVVESTSGFLSEVTASGQVVWSYNRGGEVVRARRYGFDYPGVAGLTGTQSSSILLASGWNLVSVPLLTTNMSASTIFPQANSPVFGFSNGYNSITTLENGKGYWVRYPAAASSPVTGSAFDSTIAVQQGWNLIGVRNATIATTAITSVPAGIINSPFYGYENGYTAAPTLLPGRGYWVRCDAAGTITLRTSD